MVPTGQTLSVGDRQRDAPSIALWTVGKDGAEHKLVLTVETPLGNRLLPCMNVRLDQAAHQSPLSDLLKTTLALPHVSALAEVAGQFGWLVDLSHWSDDADQGG